MNTITGQLAKLPEADRWRLLAWLAARHPGVVAQGLALLVRTGPHQDVPVSWRIRGTGVQERTDVIA